MIIFAFCAVWFGLVLFVISLGHAAANGDEILRQMQEEELAPAAIPIPRREAFIGSVDAEVLRAHRYERPLSVAIVEIDDDTERSLAEIGRRLDGVARHSDVLGRIADRQLGVLMPETGQPEALRASLRLLGVTEEPVEGRSVQASIGVAALEPGDTAGTLLRRAEDALFNVKRAGHGAVGAPIAAETDLRR
jgi:diguanylate cyclase (GGDEF)-like protein